MIKFLTTLIFLTLSFIVHCQGNRYAVNNDLNYSLRTNVDSIKDYYYSKTYKPLAYINGKEYKQYHHYQQSSPYFMSSHGVGNIYINGNKYSNLNIIYDTYIDEIITIPTEFASKNVLININKLNIDSVDILVNGKSYTLTNIKNISSISKELTNGFYEIVYSKKYRLLYQYTSLQTKQDGLIVYKHEINKYLFVKGHYYEINSKRKFFSIFPEHKKSLKKRFRELKEVYKNLNTSQMIDLVKHSESL